MTTVGRCSTCGGPIALAEGRLHACCPCGASRIPAAVFTAAARGQQITSTSGRTTA